MSINGQAESKRKAEGGAKSSVNADSQTVTIPDRHAKLKKQII